VDNGISWRLAAEREMSLQMDAERCFGRRHRYILCSQNKM
jgi:hypothetical protein